MAGENYLLGIRKLYQDKIIFIAFGFLAFKEDYKRGTQQDCLKIFSCYFIILKTLDINPEVEPQNLISFLLYFLINYYKSYYLFGGLHSGSWQG